MEIKIKRRLPLYVLLNMLTISINQSVRTPTGKMGMRPVGTSLFKAAARRWRVHNPISLSHICRQPPINLFFSLARQVLIDPGEMTVTQKSPVGRERWGMGGLEDQVTTGVDELPLVLGIVSPQQKHQPLMPLVQKGHRPVRELLPSLFLVGTGPFFFNTQNAIEKQHPLPCPGDQVAVMGRNNPKISRATLRHSKRF